MSCTLQYSDYVSGAIAWYCDGDEGGLLGEVYTTRARAEKSLRTELAKAAPDPEEVACTRLDLAMFDYVESLSPGTYTRHRSGAWVFTNAKVQKEALRFARAAYKQAKANAPWPVWALQAKAAGWTPPEGWKP